MSDAPRAIDGVVAGRLRLVGLDVDGVLTDGGVYIGQASDGLVELKRFDIQDGVAVWLLREAGLAVALVSGRASPATELRARELKVDELIQDSGGGRKLPPFEAMLERRGLGWEECAFVGDDLADLPLLRRVGLPIAVANAVPEVQSAATYVTRARGGYGAVREAAEAIVRARGVWDELLETYLRTRGDADVVARSR